MKNLILVLTVFLSTTVSTFASGPKENITLIKVASVEVSIDNDLNDLFTKATFNDVKNTLEFTTESDIKYIQIYNENGELEFQLPVMSKKVKISKKLFEQGNHKLGFLMAGENDIKFTSVTIR